MGDGLGGFGHKIGAAIDQAAVDLHHISTCADLAHGVGAAQDAAHANNGKAAAKG